MSEYKYCEFQVIDLPLFFLPNHLTRTTPPRDASKWVGHALVKSNIEMKIEKLRVGHFRRAETGGRSIQLYFSIDGGIMPS